MSRPRAAAKGRADANQSAIKQAIEAIGLPVMDLSAAGNGVEDLLVAMKTTRWQDLEMVIRRWFLFVEVKRPRNKRGEATASQFTPAQQKWRDLTRGWPRVTVTSAQDAVTQLQRMTR